MRENLSDETGGTPHVNLEFPSVHEVADVASGQGQNRYLRLSAIRLVSLLAAALSSALMAIGFDPFGLVILLAFFFAALAELLLIIFQPERAWYSGRAIAESAKTLAWRFAVQGNPFGPNLEMPQAEVIFRERITQVIAKGRDQLNFESASSMVTESMRDLRRRNFADRRDAYLEHRTEEQRNWYANKADFNKKWATGLRFGLLVGELLALTVAAIALGRNFPVDFAGVVAALVASAAAWLAIKQHAQLGSAYTVAASELAIQQAVLESTSELDWAQAVADAEEAISREHTMWLASRGQESLKDL